MDEVSGKVQNANTHILRSQNHEHAQAVSQFKGQFKGAMERYAWVRFTGKLTPCHKNTW